MSSLNTNLQAIADLCWVECPCSCHGFAVDSFYHHPADDGNCPNCGGDNRIPDPNLKGLLSVVQDECLDCQHNVPLGHGRFRHSSKHCGGTGYIVAPIWQELIEDGREGALAGTLQVNLPIEMGVLIWGLSAEACLDEAWCARLAFVGKDYPSNTWFYSSNPDLAATEVVKKWLEERHEVQNSRM